MNAYGEISPASVQFLEGVEIRKRTDGEGEMCLCGKSNIIDLRYIQLKSDKTTPLLQVGNCCVRKFMERDEDANTRRICPDCRNYCRSKYGLCGDCRDKRERDARRRDQEERETALEERRKRMEEANRLTRIITKEKRDTDCAEWKRKEEERREKTLEEQRKRMEEATIIVETWKREQKETEEQALREKAEYVQRLMREKKLQDWGKHYITCYRCNCSDDLINGLCEDCVSLAKC